MIKLKPCPFCGCTKPDINKPEFPHHRIMCPRCAATFDDYDIGMSEEGAIKKWNTRANPIDE